MYHFNWTLCVFLNSCNVFPPKYVSVGSVPTIPWPAFLMD